MSLAEQKSDSSAVECHRGRKCPDVNGGDIWRLIAERDYLSQRFDEMESLMALARAEIEKLRQEKEELKEENKSLRHQLKQMRGKIFKPRVKPGHDGNLRSAITVAVRSRAIRTPLTSM